MSSIEKKPLKVLRVSANLTQEETAKEVGVNRTTYGNWENYKSYPDAPQLVRLSEVFKCSMDAFYFPTDASLKLVKDEEEVG